MNKISSKPGQGKKAEMGSSKSKYESVNKVHPNLRKIIKIINAIKDNKYIFFTFFVQSVFFIVWNA